MLRAARIPTPGKQGRAVLPRSVRAAVAGMRSAVSVRHAAASKHRGAANAEPVRSIGRTQRGHVRCHLVVLFDENVSFDHYFATYPQAANTDGTPFHPSPAPPRASTTCAPRGSWRTTPTGTCPNGSPHARP